MDNDEQKIYVSNYLKGLSIILDEAAHSLKGMEIGYEIYYDLLEARDVITKRIIKL